MIARPTKMPDFSPTPDPSPYPSDRFWGFSGPRAEAPPARAQRFEPRYGRPSASLRDAPNARDSPGVVRNTGCRLNAEDWMSLDNWEMLARAPREHGEQNGVSSETETGFGPRYEVDGPLSTPAGRRPRVRTVWQLDHGEVAPRLITAYPLGGSS
jgi:hypothetical protein